MWVLSGTPNFAPENVESAMWEIGYLTKLMGPSPTEKADPTSSLAFDVFGLGKLACTLSPRFLEAFRRPLPGLHGYASERGSVTSGRSSRRSGGSYASPPDALLLR